MTGLPHYPVHPNPGPHGAPQYYPPQPPYGDPMPYGSPQAPGLFPVPAGLVDPGSRLGARLLDLVIWFAGYVVTGVVPVNVWRDWLVAVGPAHRPAIATTRVLRTPLGVEEDIAVAFGYGEGEAPPLDGLAGLAAELDAGHGLVTLLVSVRSARRDLTVPPRIEAPPLPVAFALGRAEAERLGRPAEAARHYRLGDGSDAAAWERLRDLVGRLGLGGRTPERQGRTAP